MSSPHHQHHHEFRRDEIRPDPPCPFRAEPGPTWVDWLTAGLLVAGLVAGFVAVWLGRS